MFRRRFTGFSSSSSSQVFLFCCSSSSGTRKRTSCERRCERTATTSDPAASRQMAPSSRARRLTRQFSSATRTRDASSADSSEAETGSRFKHVSSLKCNVTFNVADTCSHCRLTCLRAARTARACGASVGRAMVCLWHQSQTTSELNHTTNPHVLNMNRKCFHLFSYVRVWDMTSLDSTPIQAAPSKQTLCCAFKPETTVIATG